MDPMVILISFSVLAFVVLFSLALFRRTSSSSTVTLTQRLEAFKNDPTGGSMAVSGDAEEVSHFKQRSYSGLPILSGFFQRMKGSEEIALNLERAGIPLRVAEYYMIRWAVAALFFCAPFVFGVSLFNAGVGIALGVVGYMLPAMWVGNKKKKRTNQINAQLVDLLGMSSNSLKSGYGLMQSFEFAGKQLPDPLGHEIRRMLREGTLGASSEQALHALGQRVDSQDLDMVITAINIQRAVGGNLSEILDNVASTMRERERIRGEISTLTSQQKLTGIVIGMLPVFMFAIFMVLNPGYMGLLFTTTAGRGILGGSMVMELLGYFTIKRIIAIEV